MTCPVDNQLNVTLVRSDTVGGAASVLYELSCGHLVLSTNGVLVHGIKQTTATAVKPALKVGTAVPSAITLEDTALRHYLAQYRKVA